MGKLHFTTLNYALDYTLHPKPSECTLCSLNYYTYHTLHPGVTFAVIFDRILLHVSNICFLLRWNKLKSLKHHFWKSIKTKTNFFYACVPLPKFRFFSKPLVPPTHLTHHPVTLSLSYFNSNWLILAAISLFNCKGAWEELTISINLRRSLIVNSWVSTWLNS